jgi:hypothetical protein
VGEVFDAVTRAVIADALVLAGAGILVYGVALVHPAAAWITVGVLCIAGGLTMVEKR